METAGTPMAPVPGRIVEDRVLPPGAEWSGIVAAGQILRIVDLEGKQAVDFLCYDADDPADRYNAADTMKYAGTIYLTKGHGLFSTKAQKLFTIVADTAGGHDTIGGCCSPGSNGFRYGAADAPNCYDNLLRALGRFGLGARDIVANVNFFMNVPVGADGAMAIADGRSRPGDYVELRAERRTIAAISNCPQTRNPANGFNPTPIRLVIYDPST